MTVRLNDIEINAAMRYGLQPGEAKLFVALRKSYPDILPHGKDRLNKDSRKVWVCNLRKKLKPHGYSVHNIHGLGYQLVEIAA